MAATQPKNGEGLMFMRIKKGYLAAYPAASQHGEMNLRTSFEPNIIEVKRKRFDTNTGGRGKGQGWGQSMTKLFEIGHMPCQMEPTYEPAFIL